MNLRQQFINAAQKDFSFLADEYGFSYTPPESDSSLESLRYEKLPLYVEISWYKGEMDVIVGYAGETAILRPYKSRIFLLTEIALHRDSSALKDAPRFPNYITTENEILTAVAYWSQTLKKYGPELLNGDISLLEDIATKRS
ncbi:MAG: hypothetical protein QNJ26_18745 [Desulfobacterales bacterium]|nr:hypothetical protein [Desulfobacterales bacterium]